MMVEGRRISILGKHLGEMMTMAKIRCLVTGKAMQIAMSEKPKQTKRKPGKSLGVVRGFANSGQSRLMLSLCFQLRNCMNDPAPVREIRQRIGEQEGR